MYINETTLLDIVASIQRHLLAISAFRRASTSARRTFSTDLSLIALGVRSGYLVDTISPADPCNAFSDLLRAVREELKIFESVVVIHDCVSDQIFFINAMLLHQRAALVSGNSCLNGRRGVHFVLLEDTPTLLLEIPEPLQRLVSMLIDQLPMPITYSPAPLAISLPAATSALQTLIPLAAVLLEYPIAYVPPPSSASDGNKSSAHSTSASSHTFLSGEPVDVYRCMLVDPAVLGGAGTDHKRGPTALPHPLLQFSCPVRISQQHACLAPDLVVSDLIALFTERLNSPATTATPSSAAIDLSGDGNPRRGLEVVVTRTRGVFDRLAL